MLIKSEIDELRFSRAPNAAAFQNRGVLVGVDTTAFDTYIKQRKEQVERDRKIKELEEKLDKLTQLLHCKETNV